MAEEVRSALSRRAVLAGAWSVPVIAAAAAVPSALASGGSPTVAWDGVPANVDTFAVLDGTESTMTSHFPALWPQVPNSVVLRNGPAEIIGPITGVIGITWQSGVPAVQISEDTIARGFAVIDIPGAVLGPRTITQRHLKTDSIRGGGLDLEYVSLSSDETSQSFTLTAASVAADAVVDLGPVVFALTARTRLGIAEDMKYTVTVSLFDGMRLIGSASDVIHVFPDALGQGIL